MTPLKQKIQESLISNTRNLRDGKLTNIKQSLDEPAFLTSLVESCMESNVDIEITSTVDKILLHKDKFGRFDYIKIDLDKWSLYKLPKHIQVDCKDKSGSYNRNPAIIVRSKSGTVDGYTFNFWNENVLLLVSNYGTKFTNCNFLSGFQFGFAGDVWRNDKYYKLTSTKVAGYENFDYEIDFEGDGNPAELIKTNFKSGNKFADIENSCALINFIYKYERRYKVNFPNICKYLEDKYGKKQGNLPIKFDYMS